MDRVKHSQLSLILSESPRMEDNFLAQGTVPIPPWSRRSLVRGGLAMAAAFLVPSLHAEQTDLQDEVWSDTARNRDVPALVRWPAAQAKGVVIFSHGQGGKRTGADVWGLAWAQAGFLVVHLQHPGSDAAAVKSLGAFNKSMAPEQLVARVGDVKFAMDEIARRQRAGQARWAEVPQDHMALAGHSFGARTAQAMAGQAFPKASGWSGADRRIKAFIALSPSLGRGATPAQAKEDAKGMTRPMLLVSGSLDGEILNNGESVASRRMVYDVLPSGAKSFLWLNGADHMTFAGVAKQIPSNFIVRRDAATLAAEQAHHLRVAVITTAWLKEQLLAQPMGTPGGLAAGDIWLRG
jgi:predicted dienelactone hydrolase